MFNNMNKEIDIIKKHLSQNQYIEAERIAFKCLDLYPENYLAYLMHGICCLSLNSSKKAVDSFEIGLKFNSNDFGLNHNMSVALLRLEEFEKASRYIEKSIEIQPSHPLPYMERGSLNMKLRNFIEARLSFEQSIKICEKINTNWDEIPLLTNYFESLVANSDIDYLIRFYQAIQKRKFNPELFYMTMAIKPEVHDEKQIQNIVKQIESIKYKNLYDKTFYLSSVYYGSARFYEKKDQNLSESYYHKGNTSVQAFQRFNMFKFQKQLKKTMEVYQLIKHKVNLDQQRGKGIIFIVGMPRSGTTLVESIIANSSNVFSGGELTSMLSLFKEFIQQDSFEKCHDDLEEIASIYLNRIQYLKNDCPYFIDKMPENYFFIGLIALALPGAKFIHVNRDPWDTAISLYKQRYIRNVHYSSDFFSIAVQIANYIKMMDFWKNNLVEQDKKKMLSVEYEDVVSSPKELTLKMQQFCNLEQNEGALKERKGFFSNTASMSQVRSEINTRSIKKSDFIDKKESFEADLNQQIEYWVSH